MPYLKRGHVKGSAKTFTPELKAMYEEVLRVANLQCWHLDAAVLGKVVEGEAVGTVKQCPECGALEVVFHEGRMYIGVSRATLTEGVLKYKWLGTPREVLLYEHTQDA